MRLKQTGWIIVTIINLANPLVAQNKLAIDDRALVLTGETEHLLNMKLEADTISIVQNIEIKRKCDYWFASTSRSANNIILSIKDCNDMLLGSRDLGSKITTAADADKALLLYYAITEIINNPTTGPDAVQGERKATEPEFSKDQTVPVSADPGQHKSRYFFAPSAYNLDQGELYYNSLYFFLHDVQYGVSNNFSLGMGTTIIGMPFYLTPKISIPVNDVSSFALGDMVLFGTWGSDFFGNLLYLSYTRGGYKNNISIGTGLLYTSENSNTFSSYTPVLNLSGLGKISDHIYFISENYISRINSKETAASNYYDDISEQWIYESDDFSHDIFFIYGLTGFRFINKSNDTKCWQIGLSYLYTLAEDIPSQYKGTTWTTTASEGSNFITIPVIGYTRKFALKY